jgi:hypothetical protein
MTTEQYYAACARFMAQWGPEDEDEDEEEDEYPFENDPDPIIGDFE